MKENGVSLKEVSDSTGISELILDTLFKGNGVVDDFIGDDIRRYLKEAGNSSNQNNEGITVRPENKYEHKQPIPVDVFELVIELNNYMKDNKVSVREVAIDTNIPENVMSAVCEGACSPSLEVLHAIKEYLKQANSISVKGNTEEYSEEVLLGAESRDKHKVLIIHGTEGVEGQLRFKQGDNLLSIQEVVDLFNKGDYNEYTDGEVKFLWKGVKALSVDELKEIYYEHHLDIDYVAANIKARYALSKLPEAQTEFLEGDTVIDQALNYFIKYLVD